METLEICIDFVHSPSTKHGNIEEISWTFIEFLRLCKCIGPEANEI